MRSPAQARAGSRLSTVQCEGADMQRARHAVPEGTGWVLTQSPPGGSSRPPALRSPARQQFPYIIFSAHRYFYDDTKSMDDLLITNCLPPSACVAVPIGSQLRLF